MRPIRLWLFDRFGHSMGTAWAQARTGPNAVAFKMQCSCYNRLNLLGKNICEVVATGGLEPPTLAL